MSNLLGAPAAFNLHDIRIKTQAGGTLTYSNVSNWQNPCLENPLEDSKVVDAYVEQVCFYVNRVRKLNSPQRAMLSLPQSFYEVLQKEGVQAGCMLFRTARISKEEFQQLEYFFVPINFNEHSSLIIISPLDRTIEFADSMIRSHRATSKIFDIIIRFLIHEFGQLTGNRPWKFLYGNAPVQASLADCGNYTCLYAKTLALQRPLTQESDIGQGPEYSDEHNLKNRIISELEINPWTREDFPWGKEDPVARHYGRNTMSEPQHQLFSIHDLNEHGAEALNLHELRSNTGRP